MPKHHLDYHIKAVIFDMDGVITDSMKYHMKAWEFVLASHGLKVSKNDIYKREGQRGIDSVAELFDEYRQTFDMNLGSRILSEKEEYFKKIVKLKFITGSRSFLKNLNKQGFRLALVTGTARHEVLRMLPRNIFNLFEVVVCGCEVKNGKPHPEPYLKALRDLKMNAEDAVVIENAPFGIKSAKSACLRCLALETSLPREFLKEADKVFNSFAHITSAVHFLRT